MRVAFVYRNLNRSGSLERDSVFLLEGREEARYRRGTPTQECGP